MDSGDNVQLRLTLYLTGATTNRSLQAKRRLAELSEHIAVSVEIDVVDVLDEPERAEHAGVIATPTLVRESPGPTQRVVGDLASMDRLISGLGLAGMRREVGLA